MVNFLNRKVVQVAGYNIHLAFFVATILLIVGITVAILLIRRDSENNSIKDNKFDRVKITDWQRAFIISYLNEQKAEALKDSMGEDSRYVELIDKFINYLKTEKLWNKEVLQSMDSDFLLVFNTILLEKSKDMYLEGDPNSALLLAHTIDLMNGGEYLFGYSKEWIGSDVSEMMQHDQMSAEEGRLFAKSKDMVFALAGYLYSDQLKRNPAAPSYLDHIIIDDLEAALADIQSSMSFTDLRDETYDVLVFAFYNSISGYLKRGDNMGILREYQLYDVRCLCCALDYDHALYDYILDTIE